LPIDADFQSFWKWPEVKLLAMISPDHDLIQACLRQDQDGWKDLISRYQRLIYSVAHSLCPLPEDTADIFQQVCLELHRNLHQLRNEQTLSAWLITVTRRRAYAFLRAQKPQVPIEDFDAAVDARIDSLEKEFEIERAMLQLPERCERLLRLLYFDIDEPSYVDIAQKMNMPVASVGPTRARCLAKLKRLVDI
jgi:RNA polymerase sigma factor (sigma-70 family)